MYLSELENMFRGDEVCLYDEDDGFIDDDESVSEYLVRHYGNCEILDLSTRIRANETIVEICIDYKKDDEDEDEDGRPTYDDLSLDDSDYQADYDKMEHGHNDY